MTNPTECDIILGYEKSTLNKYAALAQLDRVTGYEPVGRGFESLMPRQKPSHLSMAWFFDYVNSGQRKDLYADRRGLLVICPKYIRM